MCATYRSIILIVFMVPAIAQLNGQVADVRKLPSSQLFAGNNVTAFRDPMVLVHKNVFYLYFTLTEIEKNGSIYMYTAMSKSKDLLRWSSPKKITPRNQSLNYSSPGNIIRYKDAWIMCLQTYPRPGYTVSQMPMYGDQSSRLFIMRSKDLVKWSAPECMLVKGDTVAQKDMGRMIDPFLIEDRTKKGKWWIFYKQNGASRSWSYDLRHWTYAGHMPAGENICIISQPAQYIMFHSPENGIGIKRSADLVNWKDDAETITLGQPYWNWAKGRITAGFVLDMEKPLAGGFRYLMFFHGSGPRTEKEGDFDKNASIGLAWSKDLYNWKWKL